MSDNLSGKELERWYRQAKQAAIANKIAPDEVDWLIQTVTSLDKLALRLGRFQDREQIPSSKSLPELAKLWQQRLQERIPVQYLVETVFWRRFKLKVTPAVLIPRPETELIIDIAQENNLIESGDRHWVDLGTGSGAIAFGLTDIFPQATIHAVDLSSEALAVARSNAVNLKLERQIRFYQGSWWSPLEFLVGKVTGVVANPPYIPTTLIDNLQPEVVKHEPHLALDGGEDGLRDIRYLIQATPQYLTSGGILLIEIMAGQADEVTKLLQQSDCYYGIKSYRDFNNVERFVMAYRR